MIVDYLPLIVSILSILGFITLLIMVYRSNQPNTLRFQLLIVGLISVGSMGLTVHHMYNRTVTSGTSAILSPEKTQNTQSIKLESPANGLQGVLWYGNEGGLRLSSATGPLFVNSDVSQETLLHYNNNANIILGYDDSGWKGKVGIGTKNPAWALDVASSLSPQSGSGPLTEQLTHYNGGRVLLQASANSPLKYTDIEGLYGAVHYNSTGATTESYLVGTHGDVFVTGEGNIGPQMITGLWGSATYAGTGTNVDMLMGVRGEITVNSGSGVRATSLYAAKPELNGGETDYTYGVFIEDMSGMGAKRAKNPFALYSVGTNPSYLAGSLGIATASPLAPLDIYSDHGLRLGGSREKYAALFSTGMGIDLNVAGGDLFLEYDRSQAVDILNGTVRVAPGGTVSLGGNLILGNARNLGVETSSGDRNPVLFSGVDDGIRLVSEAGSLFINSDTATETSINYGNNTNILLGYSPDGWQGKVGIGTLTPAVALDVRSESGIRIGDDNKFLSLSTNGAGADIGTTGSDLFIEYDKTGAVDFLQGSLHLTTAGKIGIGTLSPQTALDIYSDSGLRIGDSETKHLSLFTSGTGIDIEGAGGDLFLEHDKSGAVDILQSSLHVTTTGRVGVGTTAPASALDVSDESGIRIGTSSKALSLFTSGTDTDIVSFGKPLRLNYNALQAVDIHNGSAYFGANGKIGFGTTSPQERLDIAGNLHVSGTVTSDALVSDGALYAVSGAVASEVTLSVSRGGTGAGSFTDNGIIYGNGTGSLSVTTAGTSGQVLRAGASGAPEWATLSTIDHGSMGGLVHDDHTQYLLLSGRAGGQTVIGGSATTDGLTLQTTSGVGATGADIHFLVGSNGNLEAMTILNNGNVGIGTNAPGVPLQVYSASGMRVGSNTKYIDLFTVGGGNDITSSHTLHLNFLNNQDVSIGEGGVSDLFVSGRIGVGTPNPLGALDITSTTGGLVVPRMTTEQRDALTAVNGTIIYNTSTNQFNFYENAVWVTK